MCSYVRVFTVLTALKKHGILRDVAVALRKVLDSHGPAYEDSTKSQNQIARHSAKAI